MPRRRVVALALLAALLVPLLAWNLVSATVAEGDRPDRTVRFHAAQAHSSVHEWNVTFGLPLPAPLYDAEPALEMSVSGMGFDGPTMAGASLTVAVTLLVNGVEAGGDTTRFEGGNVGVRWTAPEEWDAAPLRFGGNVVTFRVLVENAADPGARGEWVVEMRDARVRLSGAP